MTSSATSSKVTVLDNVDSVEYLLLHTSTTNHSLAKPDRTEFIVLVVAQDISTDAMFWEDGGRSRTNNCGCRNLLYFEISSSSASYVSLVFIKQVLNKTQVVFTLQALTESGIKI